MRIASLLVFPLLAAVAGCEQRFDVEPTNATEESYRDQIDFEKMPTETRALYDHVLDGSLAGAKASDYQRLFDTAQQIRDQQSNIIYIFQLTDFERPFEEVHEEFVPFMYIAVQKKYGHIYKCDIADPEW